MANLPQGVEHRQVRMAECTTMGIGGPADLVVVEEATALPVLVAGPHRFLGKGANLLVTDDPLAEPVLTLGKSFKSVELTEHGDEALVRVGGAFDLAALVGRMARAGWAGLEGLAGVPASLGGALRMNAGTAHRWVHDCVQRVEVLTPGALEPQWLAAEDYSAVYRDGGLPAGTWYLRAEFRLKRGEPEQLQATARELKAHKAASQPLAAQSAGCIFKNPSPTMPAGKLLDELGCKNWQIGAARLSEQHANFIVNDGGALAQDVVRLIQQLRRHAWHERGVVLHCEVQRWLPDDPLDCHPSDIAAEQVRGHYAD